MPVLIAFLILVLVVTGVIAPLGGGSVFAFTAFSESVFDAEYPASVPAPDQKDYVGKSGEIDYDAYMNDYDRWSAHSYINRLSPGRAASMKAYIDASARGIFSANDGKNKLYSPVNVYLALSMLSEITNGGSRAQILSALGVNSIESLRAQASAVWTSIYIDDGQTKSVPASSVWLRNDFEYKPDALRILAEEYFASSFRGEMGSAEYDRMIQTWLSQQTGGLLDKQAQKITFDPDTMIALASSLYFKAGWTSEFDKEKTSDGIFHAPACDMPAEFMNKSSSDTYYWGENFGAVAFSMTNGGKMWFILPDEGVTPESLFENGEITSLVMNAQAYEEKKTFIIHKSIPKFDVTSENDLIDVLRGMGVTDVFDKNQADFTPLTEEIDMAASKVQHDVRVLIDEEGVEAAAYTVIFVLTTGMRPPEDEMHFVADRPFAFVITSQDGLPMFMGVVNHIVQ